MRIGGDPGAPAVLLLHGFAGSGEDWSAAAATLVAAGFRAVAIDLPGHGATAAPAGCPLDRFAMEQTALDLTALLDDLGVARAHWVGYSMGGRIALGSALAHPDRVATLTLESAGAGIADAGDRAERRRADETLAAAIESRGAAWFADSWGSLPIFESQRSLPESVRADLARRRKRCDPAGLAASLRAVGQGAQPYGGDRLFPQALHVVIPDAGHNVHLEQPEWFGRSLLTHLRRHGGRVPLESPATP